MKNLPSIDPANLQLIGEVPFSTADEIADKVNRAHKAKRPWKDLG